MRRYTACADTNHCKERGAITPTNKHATAKENATARNHLIPKRCEHILLLLQFNSTWAGGIP